MEFSFAIALLGLVLFLLGTFLQIVRAFQQSIWWGLAYLFLPIANLVFLVCHWARARGSFFCMLIGVALIALGGFISEKGLSANSLVAALTFSNDDKGIERLTASIEAQRTRIESLEGQFQSQGADLTKQYQLLDKRRKELEGKDPTTVQRFNVEAEAYSAQNNAQKAIGVELESARKELSSLLDERARLRALNSSDPAPDAGPTSTPAAETATAAASANRKRVVMYTTSTCPACVAAKSYLSRKGVQYEERDVNLSSAARQEFQSLGGRGVPLIVVGNERMEGFNPQRFERMIGG